MSIVVTDTKGDVFRSCAGVAAKYYGYDVSVLDLRNPMRSGGFNMLYLVNRYMDAYLQDEKNISLRAKAERYAKITAKTIIFAAGAALSSAGQALQSVLSTAMARLNSFLDSELESILCFQTDIDAERFCKNKSAIFLVMPEEFNTRYFLISLIVQQ